jgi:hypothetical protein
VALEKLRITYDKQDEQLQKKLRRDKHNGKTIYKLKALYRYKPGISTVIVNVKRRSRFYLKMRIHAYNQQLKCGFAALIRYPISTNTVRQASEIFCYYLSLWKSGMGMRQNNIKIDMP